MKGENGPVQACNSNAGHMVNVCKQLLQAYGEIINVYNQSVQKMADVAVIMNKSKTPDSCALMPPDLVERLTGAAVAGERVDDKAMATVQECSWFNVARAPNAQFGQVAVFVQ